MKKRILGKTGLEVSVIGFGGIKLPGVQMDDAVKIVNKALDLGQRGKDRFRSER